MYDYLSNSPIKLAHPYIHDHEVIAQQQDEFAIVPALQVDLNR
jgi:hypothetical protein